MDKVITFTVMTGEYCMIMKTKSLLADESDKRYKFPAAACVSEMRRLTLKYYKRDIDVLFDYED